MTILFEPITLNNMIVPNRLVRSATNDRMANFTGNITDTLIAVYEALAAGGVGLIITGHAYVTSNGKAKPGMIGIHDDSMIPGLTRLVKAVHKYDVRIAVQINHAGRQTNSSIIGETPVAPSDVYNPLTKETPRELTEEEIEDLIEEYVVATRRAIEAGFDGVQIHCAHGYLGSQFISPYTNKRDDQWGGSVKNRMRFPREVYRRIRKSVGENYPVMIKLNSEDFLNGGLTIDDSVKIAETLSRDGIDAIEISGAMAESNLYMARKGISEEEDEAYFLPNARAFKKVIDVPLILVGGVRSPDLIERLLAGGEAEMISMSRPFIREPGLVNQWKNGSRRKANCISCNGCLKYRDEPVRCILLDEAPK